MEATLSEPPIDRAGEKTAILTYILSYEDLITPAATSFRLGESIVIGRASDDGAPGFRLRGELRIADRWMSGEHARIERRSAGWFLRDCGSRNGTYVDGARAIEQPLGDGALIEVGHSLFCFRQVPERLAAALERPADEREIGSIVTHSPEVAQLLAELRQVAPSKQPILILAETGAGKESLAEDIHHLSGRRGELCAVDCGAVPESLFESTFFGHARGAFTGASESRIGAIVRADGGTLFLDEVGNLASGPQSKLLRVLETGEVTPLGAAQSKRVDARWVAATNRDLFNGDFRQDLLRRLAGYVARVPPLRQRREDLGVLAAALLSAAGVERASITVPAARALFTGALPGNVRQLRAALATAALLAQEAPIAVEHLPAEEAAPKPEAPPESRSATPDAAAIEAALTATSGNVVHAAKRLGAHPRQLYRWIERYGISLERFRG